MAGDNEDQPSWASEIDTKERLARLETATEISAAQRQEMMTDIREIKRDVAGMRQDFAQHVLDDAKTATDIHDIKTTLEGMQPALAAINSIRDERDRWRFLFKVVAWLGALAAGVWAMLDHILHFLAYLRGQ